MTLSHLERRAGSLCVVGTSRIRLVVLCAAVAVVGSAIFIVVRSNDTSRLTPYRWHSVINNLAGEIVTVDGIADPQRKTFSMHVHSSIGLASGGNLVMSNDRWFAQDQHGRWCSDPLPANQLRDANAKLDTPGIDPVHWRATLADGATSPTIDAASFFDFVAQPATVHRTGSTITAQFLARPGGVRSQTLNFWAFGHAPKISPPKTFKPCTTTAGD